MNDTRGPIEHFSWAKFIVLGEEHSQDSDVRIGKGKDIMIVGKKVRRWKERRGHLMDKSMVKRILEEDVDILVIGNGVNGALTVPDEVVEFLKDKGIGKVIVEETPKACKSYNKYYHKGEKVALLAHGTC